MELHLVPRACPLCKSVRHRQVLRDRNRREGHDIEAVLVECYDCSMRYLDPAPDESSLIRLYNDGTVDPVMLTPKEVTPVSKQSTQDFSAWKSVRRSIHEVLRGHPHDWPDESGNGRSILDFGCHTGAKLIPFHQRGWNVAGIDLNEKAIAVARAAFPQGQFWCGDVLTLDIPGRFDVIRTDNVLEHLRDPMAYLARLASILKPEGRIFIIVPNAHAFSVLFWGRYSYVYWMPFHLNLFTARTMRYALERSGLAIVRCRTFSPVASWTHTWRQLLLKPGYDRRPASKLDVQIRRLGLLNYPGECLTQWLGWGEELVITARRPE